jgi:2-methylisocitrate lyase-like PEP mutase family enzyme
LEKLKDLIKGSDLIVAPVALNPIMAQMAALAGFKAAYLSGGSLGWYKGVTEAGLSLTEMIQVVVDIRTVCKIPVVLDAGGGWGDPVHIHRTVTMSEAGGVECIEIEDQLLPRRVEHHVGIDRLVPDRACRRPHQGGRRRPHRPQPGHRRAQQCAPGRGYGRRAAAGRGHEEGRRRHAVPLGTEA